MCDLEKQLAQPFGKDYGEVLEEARRKLGRKLQPEDDWSGLSEAAAEGNEELVRLLLERRADVNQMDDVGRTPLIRAVMGVRAEVTKILLENGADVSSNRPQRQDRSQLRRGKWSQGPGGHPSRAQIFLVGLPIRSEGSTSV